MERALQIVRDETADGSATQAARLQRLDEIDQEIEYLIELGARLGAVEKVARQIEERERERAEIKASLVPAGESFDLRAARREIETRVADLHGLLLGSPEEARPALAHLFGDRRLRVSPDPENGFSIEGVATFELMQAFSGAGDSTRPRTCTRIELPLTA